MYRLLFSFMAPSGIGREALVRWSHDCSREMPYAFHLLVVGARNSDDQDPAGSCKMPSGERGGGG